MNYIYPHDNEETSIQTVYQKLYRNSAQKSRQIWDEINKAEENNQM